MQSLNIVSIYSRLKSILPISIIFIIALGVRAFLFDQSRVIAADGISYINIARSIFDNFNFSSSSHFPPLYPILIGILSNFTPYDEIAGKLVSTIMGSLLVIPIFLLGKEVSCNKTGYIASIITALSPPLIGISGIVLSQSTYITLLVTALYLCWKSFHSNSWKMALAAGFMFGASYLTRPEAVIVLIGISLVCPFFSSADFKQKDNLKLLVCIWSSFFILAFPYILLLHKIYGSWQLTGKSSVTLADSLGWYLNRPDLKRELDFSGLTYLDIVKHYPDFIWRNTLKNIPDALAQLRPHIWLLVLLGLASTFFSTEKRRHLLFFGASFLPLGIIIIFFWIDSHYFSPYVPILYIMGGEGLICLENGMSRIFSHYTLPKLGELAPWSLILGITLALTAIMPTLMANRDTPYHFSQDGARYDHKLIGLMLRKYLPPKSKVMAKSGRIVFYGDFQHVDIPQASLPDILQAAKNNKTRYLIADGTLAQARPQLAPFVAPLFTLPEQLFSTGPFETTDLPGGLHLILLYKDPSSVGVAVYEFPG
jgi:4-amino-4-deoxy-L-arabinose transferase-like glycosyltransferase